MDPLFLWLSWSCAIANLIAFCYKAPALRMNGRSAALFALCTYFFFNGLSYWVDLEVFRERIIAFCDYPNITIIIVQVSVVTLTAAQQISVVYLTLPPEEAKRVAKRQMIGFALALAVLVALFVAILPGKVSSAQETVYLNIQDADYALYMSYYLAICAVGRYQTVVFAVRYARAIQEFWLRLGMRFVAGGSALILVYCAVRYWQILALHTPLVTTAPWKFLFWLIADIGTLLQVLGWTIPSWGPGLSTPWFRHYRAYLGLAPLWRAVTQAAPEVTLEPTRHRLLDWMPPRDLEYRLYRRVIEIRDGQLLLSCLADPIAVHRLEQARRSEHEAVFEAALLKSAVCGAAGRSADEELMPSRRTSDISLPQEIHQLTRVSRAYRRLDSEKPRKRRPQAQRGFSS
ncbi:MAB_1171c family putative transporter [Streptomyces sp. NPDC102441]|uniref:MAB_1171c family putative transporter n=1 Tax=Streptomyces sp. NPDC102441 TaxID=3366176 RepID=UPI00381D856D